MLYTLRKEARFHDGSPITPDDVIWTFDTLREKGQPMYRSYYGDVEKVEADGERGVRFYFKSAENRELPQIVGQMPILSKKYWEGRDFTKDDARRAARQRPVQGRGGRSRALDHVSPRARLLGGRSAGQQGARIMSTTIRYDYYRDGTIALEALKAGQYDVRLENSSKAWATGYDGPALRQGLLKKDGNPERAAARHAGFRLQSAASAVPGPAGAAGAGLCVRFRMVEQEPVL